MIDVDGGGGGGGGGDDDDDDNNNNKRLQHPRRDSILDKTFAQIVTACRC